MSNIIVILNILTVVGLCVSAVLAVHFEKLLSSVIALGVTGLFAAAEFLLLHENARFHKQQNELIIPVMLQMEPLNVI